MIDREEARIGCFIFMLGTNLATLSSMTGLGMTGRVGTGTTLAMGAAVLLLLMAAGRVLIRGTRIDSWTAVAGGLATSALGAALVAHMFVYAFPALYAAAALVSLACAKPAGGNTLGPSA